MQHSNGARDLAIRPSSRIVVCGPPGSGARAQGDLLGSALRISHVSAGSLIGRLAGTGTSLGRCVERCMESAVLVPDPLAVRLVFDAIHALAEECPGGGLVLTGFPRTLRQAEALEALTRNAPIDLIVQLQTPVASQRVRARAWTPAERTREQRALSIYRRVTIPALAWLGRRHPMVAVDTAPPVGSPVYDLATIARNHLETSTAPMADH
jgi:adenylate kinase